MTRRLLALLLSFAVALAVLVGVQPFTPAPAIASAPAGESATATGPFRDGRGLQVLSAERVGVRQWRLVLATAELARPAHVVVLLPRGYQRTSRRYPVLHLLHGTSGGADDWVEDGKVGAATRELPLIVVMPDGGYDDNGGSWWTDWVDQGTALGAANWETFHIGQLVPWVDDNLRTLPGRRGRAIAGLSQGGFGAFSYAARHPDLFVSAASFSGAPDIARNPLARTAGSAVVGAIMTGLNGVQPFAAFGDPVADAIIWQGHNPADLVDNLAHTDLRLWTARGTPGELDEELPDPGAVAVEAITHLSTRFFADAADAAGVRYRLTDYVDGTHTWPYWTRSLREYLPGLMRVLAEKRTRPGQVGYRSIERVWEQWGWRVRSLRDAEHEWSALRGADRRGFTLVAGSEAVVTTPRWYQPGARYQVAYRGGEGPARVRVLPSGRLRLRVAGVQQPMRNSEVHVTLQRM
ncbi:alpha/beta hydrolase [Nocardioides ferulae]|uniref:alpha/beta hydrolase n=1 Tax=Nocardioides ferulae TaxID=2340821 RepID=UPI000EB5C955|nr:alpha/beta hydrolase family protein [Nocardioides ferulae]